MITWIVVAGYTVATLLCGRIVFAAMRADDTMAPEEGFEAVLLAALSMMTGLFWPLALPVALVMWHPRKTPAELREQIDARDQRIAELERELGIRSGA